MHFISSFRKTVSKWHTIKSSMEDFYFCLFACITIATELYHDLSNIIYLGAIKLWILQNKFVWLEKYAGNISCHFRNFTAIVQAPICYSKFRKFDNGNCSRASFDLSVSTFKATTEISYFSIFRLSFRPRPS